MGESSQPLGAVEPPIVGRSCLLRFVKLREKSCASPLVMRRGWEWSEERCLYILRRFTTNSPSAIFTPSITRALAHSPDKTKCQECRLNRRCRPPCFSATAWRLRPPPPEPEPARDPPRNTATSADACTPSEALPRAPGTGPSTRCRGQGRPMQCTAVHHEFRELHATRKPAQKAPSLVLGPADTTRVLLTCRSDLHSK